MASVRRLGAVVALSAALGLATAVDDVPGTQVQERPDDAEMEEQVSAEQAAQLVPKTRAMLARYPRCFQRCPGTVGPLDTMMGLHLSGRNGHAKGVACAHSAALSCVYKTSNMFACYPFISDEDWGSWSLPLPLTADLFRRQCRGHAAKEAVPEAELGDMSASASAPALGAQAPADEAAKVPSPEQEQAAVAAPQGEVAQKEAESAVVAEDPLEEQVSAEQAKELLPKTRAMLARYPRCFRRCPGTVGPLDTMMGLHLSGRNGHAQGVACAHSAALSCVYKTSNMFACYPFISDEDWGSWSLPLPLTADLFRRQCRGHAAKEAVPEAELGSVSASVSSLAMGAQASAEEMSKEAAQVQEEEAQPSETPQKEEAQKEAESAAVAEDPLEEQVSAEQAKELLPKTRAMLARYPRCFRRCPGTVGPLDTMMGLHLSGQNGHAQGVACAHSGAFSCVYKTSNMFVCYPFISDEDWGSWSLPLPLTADLFRRQCRGHAAKEAVPEAELGDMSASASSLAVGAQASVEETSKEAAHEQEEAAQPSETPQGAEAQKEAASAVVAEEALEEQVSAEQAKQLLPKTRAMLARYPRCFRRCPGTVGPLDTMMGLHLSGRNSHAQGVACAHSGAFSCVYKTSNMFACYPFISDEDWGSWSLPLPLTADLFRRQCSSHGKVAASTVVEASAQEEVFLP